MNHATLCTAILGATLALFSGCIADDTVGGRTITVTAADLQDGQRPLIQLFVPDRWLLDGRDAPIDLGGIDVETRDDRVTLAEWLMDEGGLSPDDVERLTRERFVLALDDSPAGEAVGSHSSALKVAPSTGNGDDCSECCTCDQDGCGTDCRD